MCRIWKMGINLFPSLDIRDNFKVAYLKTNSNNPKIYLITVTVWGTGGVINWINLSWWLPGLKVDTWQFDKIQLNWDSQQGRDRKASILLKNTADQDACYVSKVWWLVFIWANLQQYSSNHKIYIKGRFKVIATPLQH